MKRHGTQYGYTTLGCRCIACTDVHAAWQALGNADRLTRLWALPPEKHGKLTAYTNWGCRCDDCREAAIENQREYRARKKLASR